MLPRRTEREAPHTQPEHRGHRRRRPYPCRFTALPAAETTDARSGTSRWDRALQLLRTEPDRSWWRGMRSGVRECGWYGAGNRSGRGRGVRRVRLRQAAASGEAWLRSWTGAYCGTVLELDAELKGFAALTCELTDLFRTSAEPGQAARVAWPGGRRGVSPIASGVRIAAGKSLTGRRYPCSPSVLPEPTRAGWPALPVARSPR